MLAASLIELGDSVFQVTSGKYQTPQWLTIKSAGAYDIADVEQGLWRFRPAICLRVMNESRFPQEICQVALLILLSISAVSCSLSNPKPTDEEIKKAIMERGAWNPLVGRIDLEAVEIEQIGYFNSEKKYWPVKAKVTTKETRRTALLDFQVFQDDYGRWTARRAERL